jgi:hypothetical protein
MGRKLFALGVLAMLALVLATSAVGGGKRVLSASPSRLDFGAQCVNGCIGTAETTITNVGSSSVSITNQITTSGKDMFDFGAYFVGCEYTTLGPGQSCTMGMQFDPSHTGRESAYLNVCEDTTGTCVKVPMVGKGT